MPGIDQLTPAQAKKIMDDCARCQGHRDHQFCSCPCGVLELIEYPDAVWADDDVMHPVPGTGGLHDSTPREDEATP